MKSKQETTSTTASDRTCCADKMRTASKLKRGWNWEYTFCEKVMPDGTRKTLAVEYVLHHRKYGTDVVVSSYTGGHPYEAAAAEAIADAFRDFFGEARGNGIVWKEVRHCQYLTGWLIDAPIDSEIVKAFVAALATINRVTVKMKMAVA